MSGEMFKAVRKLGLEGIVSKKLNAPYKSGPRAIARTNKSLAATHKT